MKKHHVKVYPSKEHCPREQQLAFKLAQVALDPTASSQAVTDQVINRIIDNASVAVASLNRGPVITARAMALCHPNPKGATVFGLPASQRFSCEWATWANGTAVRELDYHDTYLAADYSHPGDSIPPTLAVAQQKQKSGADLLRGIISAYEIHVALVKSICLHEFKKDHIAHLCPASAGGISALLGLSQDQTYQAIQQAVHVSFTTRQSRKGEISSWKAFAPAHSSKLAIEAVDRCMRGEGAPSPIYEGEDSVIAYMLGGKNTSYDVELIEPGEEKRLILETYTKEHSAEYQSQALIDLAFRMGKKISDFSKIKEIIIHTSHHTHYVIGTGSGDPQKFDPKSTRETLDHSIMYIFAVALQDQKWHHVESYKPERAQRKDTVDLWNKIRTIEDPEWTRRYHETDPHKKQFGGKVEIVFNDGQKQIDELGVANAHPAGAKPFGRTEYIKKFTTLTEGIISATEKDRFLNVVQNLPKLKAEELLHLNVEVPQDKLQSKERDQRGIF